MPSHLDVQVARPFGHRRRDHHRDHHLPTPAVADAIEDRHAASRQTTFPTRVSCARENGHPTDITLQRAKKLYQAGLPPCNTCKHRSSCAAK